MVSVPGPYFASNLSPSSPGQSNHNVIDLTSSPSPSPVPAPRPPPPSLPQLPQISSSQPTTLESASPKTPVCIGRLDATALILYPSTYLEISHSEPSSSDPVWGPVRLQYERTPHHTGSEDTVHIKTPNKRSPHGEIHPGENFAVVEKRVASILGPMLGKGLIRLDSRIRRGNRHLPVLPLEVLIFTPKGNITVVGNFLRQSGLLLEHPLSIPTHVLYHNPHYPPPGGHARALMTGSRTDYSGPAGNSSRWPTPTVSGKTVEVQRAQVDELFKNLRGGEELEETEPPPEIGTLLYPHQKKALTFLLEREQEIDRGSKRSTLWQCVPNPITGQKSWCHLVTQTELFEAPRESKGAILADDMGLGKTITTVSLIAATLRSAKAFEAAPVIRPKPPSAVLHVSRLTAEHFTGRVWGMPSPSTSASSIAIAKSKGKEAKAQDLAEEQYARACRIKCKSRTTLVVCPLSTVANWEEQFREHWNGPVLVLGGSGSCLNSDAAGTQTTLTAMFTNISDSGGHPLDGSNIISQKKMGTPFRVYVYHGNARRPDPAFLADFDVVITTYSTLASEFSKQSRSLEYDDDAASDSENETNGKPSKVPKIGKRKRPSSNGTEATSPLQSVHWFRVVLDEAHSIKELNTVACRASCDLMADRRLCLTGTPVQNKLDDVFALIKFLKLSPLDDKATWTEFIGTPVKYGQPLGVARLQTIMRSITLRRTKESKSSNGQRILTLPPRRDELRYLKFDAQEQDLYDRFFNESKAEFHELSHKNEVMKNYVGILQKILRLRQICDDLELVRGKGLLGDAQHDASYEETVAAIAVEGITTTRAVIIFALLREAATTQCSECGVELCPTEAVSSCGSGVDSELSSAPKRSRRAKASRANTRANSPATLQAPRPVMTRCQHLFCSYCFKHKVDLAWPDCEPDVAMPCPVCQNMLRPTDAVEFDVNTVATEATGKRKTGKREKRARRTLSEGCRPSTKVKALLGDLIQFSKANPHSVNYDPTSLEVQMVDDQGNIIDDGVVKTVVFSQWTTMLDRVEDALDAAGICYERLDGTMKREDRSRAMNALKNDPGCEVLLVSLKAGGVGLNLTAAQRVYLMDPYWNPAVENQAVDRIHRLGQTKPVTTVKLIIENSIEARLLEVQKKKTELANMTLGQNFSKQDLMQRRMEELRQLFSR
ncbi:SNF2 family N-terminal domain-containing protein [Multifurca ochricompacta]|uniref:SNF2 family N-terminal domain-containing protein n=1 Tax=Multifurca ochricompacta TaxID=376703 RepID=A0AAD4MC77_9AGAM|nr:SNF2 family N-terminal domain-containing protein [Multifurca ochricompacta]